MSTESDAPNHSLVGANIPLDNEAPKIYAVADLRAYIKPPMGEELGSPAGASEPPATPGTEVACPCVPVEDCACHIVQFNQGQNICPTDPGYGCETTCGCQGYSCPCQWVCVDWPTLSQPTSQPA